MEQTFWQAHGDEVSALITVALAVLLALVVDRLVIGRASRLAERVGAAQSREAQTRLSVVRRLVFLTIIAIGVALALSQFTQIKRLATGVLASTAVLSLIIGFAAQQALSNVVAGILLAITQPLRIGDLVELEQGSGRVRDITLTFTSIGFDDGRVLVVPNQKLMTDPLFNHSMNGTTERPVASQVLPPGRPGGEPAAPG
jgi:small-conductance mechanosensitive channel